MLKFSLYVEMWFYIIKHTCTC